MEVRTIKQDKVKGYLVTIGEWHLFFLNGDFVAKARIKDDMRVGTKYYLFWEIERSELITARTIEYQLKDIETKGKHDAGSIRHYFCYEHDANKSKSAIPYDVRVFIHEQKR